MNYYCLIALAPNKCSSKPCGSFPCIETPNYANGYLCKCGERDFRPTDCNSSQSARCSELKFQNGVCVENTNGPAYCDCLPGYASDRCELRECYQDLSILEFV